MQAKTIFIVLVSVLVTIVLMNNQDPVTFWIFGDIQLSKLSVLVVFFVLGFILGFLARGKRKRVEQEFTVQRSGNHLYSDDDDRPANDDPYADENYIR